MRLTLMQMDTSQKNGTIALVYARDFPISTRVLFNAFAFHVVFYECVCVYIFLATVGVRVNWNGL